MAAIGRPATVSAVALGEQFWARGRQAPTRCCRSSLDGQWSPERLLFNQLCAQVQPERGIEVVVHSCHATPLRRPGVYPVIPQQTRYATQELRI